MIAMTAVLMIPLCDLRGAKPNTDILLYVDDRSWASQSAQDCVDFGKKWKTWSARLDLKENATKEKYYHEDPEKAMKEFGLAGVQAKTIDRSLGLLGVELAPREGEGADSQGECPSGKCAEDCTQVSVFAGCGISQSDDRINESDTQGRIWLVLWQYVRGKRFRLVDRAIAQVGPDPRMGDASLKTILRGHTASAFFMSGLQLVMAAWRRALKLGTTPGEWREHGWTRNLRNFMKSVGCDETASWRWCTRLGGIIDLNPESEDFDETNGLMAHRIREAWRKTLFDRWRTRARIDARLCATQTYSEERCAMTRKLVGTDGHRFAVAAGAAVSPQKYAVIDQDSKQGRSRNSRVSLVRTVRSGPRAGLGTHVLEMHNEWQTTGTVHTV